MISEATVNQHDELTRIVFMVSASVPYQTFTLEDPDRVVVDLPEVAWTPRELSQLPPGGLVERVRHGRFKSGTSRVVIDCRGPAVVHETALLPSRTGGYRLQIDLAAAAFRSVSSSAMVLSEPAAAPAALAADGLGGPTIAGDSRLPVIGATGLAVGDLGPVHRPPVATGWRGQAEPVLGTAALAFAAPRPRPATLPRTPAPSWVVVLDPGHGGQDPGAIGLRGTYEKQITLAAARALREELQALGRYRVVLTRNRDVFIRLRGRIAIARAAGADLFLSLHADKMENTAVRGLSVYTLSERASDAEAAALAEKENRVDLLGGVSLKAASPDVTNILIDLVQRDTMNQSAHMASLLVRELQQEILLLPKTHRFAGFAVLKSPDVPSALIELGYLSNPSEEALLRSPRHRQKLARAIARAIDGYFVSYEARNRL